MAGFEPVEDGDGLGGLAHRQQGVGAQEQRLVGEGGDGSGGGVEGVERRQRPRGVLLAVRVGGSGVDVERVLGRVVCGLGVGVQDLVERHAQADGVVGGVGGGVLVQGLGARQGREHQAFVEVDEGELVARLLGQGPDPDRLVHVAEAGARRVEVAASDGHVAQRQASTRGDAGVAAGGGPLQVLLRPVEVLVHVAQQVRERERGGGRHVRRRMSGQEPAVAVSGGVGLGRRAEVGALPRRTSAGLPQLGAHQQGAGRDGGVGVPLQDLVERPGRGGLGVGGLRLDGERQQRLAPLLLQPVERADGVERLVVVAALQRQPGLQLAQAPVEGGERRRAVDGRGEDVGRAAAVQHPRQPGLHARAVLGRDGQQLEVEVDRALVVQRQPVQVGALEQEEPVVAELAAPLVEHGGGLGELPERRDRVGDHPVGLLLARRGRQRGGPGRGRLVGAVRAGQGDAALGQQVGGRALARDPLVHQPHHVGVAAPGGVRLGELEPDRQRAGVLAVQVLQHGRRLVDAAVGEQRRGEREPALPAGLAEPADDHGGRRHRPAPRKQAVPEPLVPRGARAVEEDPLAGGRRGRRLGAGRARHEQKRR